MDALHALLFSGNKFTVFGDISFSGFSSEDISM